MLPLHSGHLTQGNLGTRILSSVGQPLMVDGNKSVPWPTALGRHPRTPSCLILKLKQHEVFFSVSRCPSGFVRDSCS